MDEAPAHRELIDDIELEVLDRYLRGHARDSDETMLLDGVHGMLTALAIGPDPALPEEWLPEILHAPFEDPEQGAAVLGLLAKLNDSIPAELESEVYEPVLGEVAPEQAVSSDLTAAWNSFTFSSTWQRSVQARRVEASPGPYCLPCSARTASAWVVSDAVGGRPYAET